MVKSCIHQITTPRGAKKPFCAGLVTTNGKVTQWAPILWRTQGWTIYEVIAYCEKQGWRIRGVSPNPVSEAKHD